MPILRIKLPQKGEITHDFAADRITIGRRPDNTIQIIDPSVSGHHAELLVEDGHYRLHDLGSTNLTFVDGAPVSDYHLHQECRITFGTIECEFDPREGSGLPRLSASQLEKDVAFLRGENADLLGQLVTQQRQIDILSSARLVTRKVDNTPFAATNDTLKSIVSERDDLRHLTTGLKLELEKLRGELTATIRERDAARQALDLLQAEKATHNRELQQFRQQAARDAAPAPAEDIPATPSGPWAGDTATSGATVTSAPPQATPAPSPATLTAPAAVAASAPAEICADVGATQRITLPLSPAFQGIVPPLKALSAALNRLSANIGDKAARGHLATQGSKLANAASPLGGHPIVRLSLAIESLLQECIGRPASPNATQVQTLLRATDLITSLLDPRNSDQAKTLPHPKVLAIDRDGDLLHTLAASLELSQLLTTTCSDCHEAQSLIEKNDYDLLVVDAGLQNGNGPLSDRLREHDRYRTTPMILLTVAGSPEEKAQAGPGRSHDSLLKPLSTTELAVKAETWIWKKRFGLL